MAYQIKLPITKDNEYGFIHLKTVNQSVLQNFKMLLLTIPGEKINDPDYGCGIPAYLFENITNGVKKEIEDLIITQAKRYLPYINFSEFIFEKKDELLYLSIKFYVGPSEYENVLTIPLTNTNN